MRLLIIEVCGGVGDDDVECDDSGDGVTVTFNIFSLRPISLSLSISFSSVNAHSRTHARCSTLD